MHRLLGVDCIILSGGFLERGEGGEWLWLGLGVIVRVNIDNNILYQFTEKGFSCL